MVAKSNLVGKFSIYLEEKSNSMVLQYQKKGINYRLVYEIYSIWREKYKNIKCKLFGETEIIYSERRSKYQTMKLNFIKPCSHDSVRPVFF